MPIGLGSDYPVAFPQKLILLSMLSPSSLVLTPMPLLSFLPLLYRSFCTTTATPLSSLLLVVAQPSPSLLELHLIIKYTMSNALSQIEIDHFVALTK